MERVLICLIGNNGDCLNGSIIARQVKADTPDAHVTFVTSAGRAGLFANNPYIDEIWGVPDRPDLPFVTMTQAIEAEAIRRHLAGQYDRLYLSQIWPSNLHNYDGSCRPSVVRSYRRPITVPIENVFNYTDAELEDAAKLVTESNFLDYEHRILFECQSLSGQSFMNHEIAQTVADYVYNELPNASMMLISHHDIKLRHPNTKHAKLHSLREISLLSRVATMFIGCGSGGTVIATVPPSEVLPTILILSAGPGASYASFAHERAYWGLPNDHMLETTNESPLAIAATIVEACTNGIGPARELFHEIMPVTFDHYGPLIEGMLINNGRSVDAARSLTHVAERYGWGREDVQTFARTKILPHLAGDISWPLKETRLEVNNFLESLENGSKDNRKIPDGGINMQRG
jgi:hypothetical protein